MKHRKAVTQFLNQVRHRFELNDMTYESIETNPLTFSKMAGCKEADVPDVIQAMQDEGIVADAIIDKKFVWVAIYKILAEMYLLGDRKLYQ